MRRPGRLALLALRANRDRNTRTAFPSRSTSTARSSGGPSSRSRNPPRVKRSYGRSSAGDDRLTRRSLVFVCPLAAALSASVLLVSVPGASGSRVAVSPSPGPSVTGARARVADQPAWPLAEIHAITVSGSETSLTSGTTFDTNPSPSPDGSTIAFVSARDGRPDVYLMDADGSNVRRVTTSPFDSAAAPLSGGSSVVWGDGGTTSIAWSPDGQKIAFDAAYAVVPDQCAHDCLHWRIYLAHPDGSGIRLVSDWSRLPSWSPNGRSIAFEQVEIGGAGVGVRVVRPGGTLLAAVGGVSTPRGLTAGPQWSPDGHRLVFGTWPGSRLPERVDVVNADGSHRRAVETGSGAVWSPDGKRLTFIHWLRLYVADAAGAKERQLSGKGEQAAAPAWSPDGRRVAFLRAPGPYSRNAYPRNQIAVVDAGGGPERQLSNEPDGARFDAGPIRAPDGQSLYLAVIQP